ncbi:MAG TPA: MG2 domain-containing protein [Bryobacteraceae bacterium]|nr:MG2 domain-containing protein [Bryobacteraceae bacterium]
MKRSLPFFVTGVLALVSASVALLTSLSHAQPKESGSVGATYAHGMLHVSIPYHAPRDGAGNLIVEILDPEDGVTGRIDRHAYAGVGQGIWEQDLPLPKTLPVEDVVWHRLHYRFTYKNEPAVAIQGIVSISRILRRASVHVLAQQAYLSGGAAAARLIVTDPDNENLAVSGSVQIELLGPERQTQVLYTGRLNERGTTQAHFRFPAGLVGSYSLHYAVDTAVGPAEYTQAIRLDDKVSILLTTEKPIYQPGQTIHTRALALDRSNHQATAGRKLTFELEDSRGNKVFRRITQTDSYGIASAEFALADEVNLGTYHLRALMDEATDAPRNKGEIALQVERYVLPRFKVSVDLSGKDARAKRGYRPGDHVTGTVRANYFFGKPVDGAEVTVKASAMDVALFEAGNSRGVTGGDGTFRFDIRLPNFFAGRSLSQGASRVLIEATVKDAAGHSESRGEPVTVSESPLLITAVPEGGTLIPGLENQVFVLTSYPDGTPAQADIQVHAPGNPDQTASTDRGGIAIVPLRGSGDMTLQVKATDRDRNRASTPVSLQSRPGSDQILLRAERAVYRAGERIRMQVFSTNQRASAYVDVVKDGQTIATHDLDIVDGRADLDLAATPDMAGTVEINAYLFGREGRPIGDHRLVFVQPADELRIETALDSPVYKPGGEARIGFRVTNRRGEGVQAALGLEIVDQAVFALAEKQPGFAKVFFYLEQEMMKPRYEIHSIGLPEAISSADAAESSQRDRAARALFSATELVGANNATVEFGRRVPQSKYSEYAARYGKRFHAQLDQLAGDLTRAAATNSGTCDQTSLIDRLKDAKPIDAWGNRLRVEDWTQGTRSFAVRSAGSDGQFDTTDDLVHYLEDRYCKEPRLWGSGTIDLKVEHGPLNGLAAITGTVLDPSGAVVPGVTIKLLEIAGGKVRTLTTAIDGRFSFVGVPAGRYGIQASAPGFRTAASEFSLNVGDRAVLSVALNIGAMTETVEVTAAASTIMTSNASISSVARITTSIRKKEASAAMAPLATPETHVRSWFPEALHVAPEIITDRRGRASITIPIADNITTWRMAMLASTRQGALGSGTSSLKVFQDFFAELDLPVTLTQGDQVSIPVAIYNYSGSHGEVRLRLQQDNWFSLVGDAPDKNLSVESGRVGGSQYTIEAKRIGKFKLMLKAEMDGPAKRADIVVREIEVVPNGREQSMVFNGRLDSTVRHQMDFPSFSIPDASTVFVRLYPGPLSQVIEGMDSLLQMPSGCFEQTSSSTYPNVLALDYMKRTKRLTPEVHAKAEGYIANGYQRLLTFEVPGGGFSWFGNAPANKILTSYGLMEFSDMSKVHDTDMRVIQRTGQWLASQQQADGSWRPDAGFINEGATNRYNTDILRITAYVAWSLEVTGYQGPAVENAKHFIQTHLGTAARADVYTLAVLANFAATYAKDRAFTGQVMQLLLDARTEQDNQVWWKAEETSVYATGVSAMVETTGLAVQALLKWGGNSAAAAKAINYIVAKKDAAGTWGTTQATIMALRALLLSTEEGGATARGAVEVVWNGKVAAQLTLTPENNDLLHQFTIKDIKPQPGNLVEIRFTGEGSVAYQVAGRYFMPWNAKPAGEPLSIDVSYDRTRLERDQIATATATVRNNLARTANMVMVDLGIPPGFELLGEDLEAYRDKSARQKGGRLEKFSLTPTQAILYFDSIPPRKGFALSFRLRAKYPIRARTFASRVYEYYAPEVSSLARPVQLEVHKR